MPAPDTAADLYGLPLDEFTPARTELVKRLKANGEKEDAARVGKLRKPTLPAWAVNQLIRTQPKAIKSLFDAGDAVADAQAGGQADGLREAAARQREELANLMGRAEGLLDSEGRTLAANVLERVAETLRAAAIDPESRGQVKDGCLTRELQFTGLGGFAAAAAAAPPAKSKKREAADQAKQRQSEIRSARERERQAKQELQEAQSRLRDAERARQSAAEQVESAEAELSEASHQLAELQRGGK